MSKMLYPNRHSPKGWRVQDKILKEQRYFPISKYGTLDKAEKAADGFNEQVYKRRQAYALRMSLPQNQIFYTDGRIIGLRFSIRKYEKTLNKPLMIIQITVNGKQISTSRQLHSNTFQRAYESIQDWICERKGIEKNRDIKELFDQAKHRYQAESIQVQTDCCLQNELKSNIVN